MRPPWNITILRVRPGEIQDRARTQKVVDLGLCRCRPHPFDEFWHRHRIAVSLILYELVIELSEGFTVFNIRYPMTHDCLHMKARIVAPRRSVLQRDCGSTGDPRRDVFAKHIGKAGVTIATDVHENDGGVVAFAIEKCIAAESSGSPIV